MTASDDDLRRLKAQISRRQRKADMASEQLAEINGELRLMFNHVFKDPARARAQFEKDVRRKGVRGAVDLIYKEQRQIPSIGPYRSTTAGISFRERTYKRERTGRHLENLPSLYLKLESAWHQNEVAQRLLREAQQTADTAQAMKSAHKELGLDRKRERRGGQDEEQGQFQ